MPSPGSLTSVSGSTDSAFLLWASLPHWCGIQWTGGFNWFNLILLANICSAPTVCPEYIKASLLCDVKLWI